MENASKQEWQTSHWKIPPRELFSLTGQTAIVTGGASGLGRAIALGLDAFGASVAIADIDIAGARKVAKMLENESLAIEIDVTRAASVSEMVRTTMQKFGRIDIAFNIPGINIRKSVLELKEDEWRRVIEVNLKGLFLSAREIGRVMLGQGKGSMVNMGVRKGPGRGCLPVSILCEQRGRDPANEMFGHRVGAACAGECYCAGLYEDSPGVGGNEGHGLA